MINMVTRFIQKQIVDDLFKGKVIVVYGPRQTGKTTLVKQIADQRDEPSVYFNCDEPDIQLHFSNKTSTQLKEYIGDARIVIFDEAQQVKNAGMMLKLLIDTYPDRQFIATGSSSFSLSDQIGEPLTGRNVEYRLFPLAEIELLAASDTLHLDRTLETRLVYGTYPEIYTTQHIEEKKRLLNTLKNNYLLTDILAIDGIKGSETLYKLLQALALQTGQEVSYPEIAQLAGIDKNTVRRYIGILEKSFVIFRLTSFSRNLRKEIAKREKVYFYDTGIRNALINNFNPLSMRNDTGHIWENYITSERMKRNTYMRHYANMYFWRTYDQQEIDLVEEYGGKLHGYEIKWQKKQVKKPTVFMKTYPGSTVSLINSSSYRSFLT